MQNRGTELDVLIAGAGPVGLFLANECARRGLKWRLIETNTSQSQHSKALAIFPRTLEILDMAGLAAPFLKAANRVTSVRVSTGDRTLAQMQFAPAESPYPFISMVPQNVSEQLLVQQLRQKGGAVEYQTTFLSAIQHDHGVTATLEHLGHREEVTAAFLVGCDGAHSAVRHQLQLPFEGAQYKDQFLLADVETNEAAPADELQLCPSELGAVAVFPMSATRRRIVATIEKIEGEAPTLELVRRILAERAPIGIEVKAMHWSSYFRVHHRQVAQLRQQRTFLAGDAAHIHSPFGGQGMNTGLHDIWNLAWKLDLFLHGHGNEQLLDSYSAERRPVIRHVIETTDRLTRAMGTPSKLAQFLRNAIIPMVSHLAPFQHAFVQRLAALDISYRGSPVIEGAGERYFDASMREGGVRSQFLLVLGDGMEKEAVAVARRWAEQFHELVDVRRGQGQQLRLIRPDGYAAFTADGIDELPEVKAILERQTGSLTAVTA